MNLIDAWKQVPNGDEITLEVHDGPDIKVVKRGSFVGVLRRLYEMTSEENILSDRWRWRIK